MPDHLHALIGGALVGADAKQCLASFRQQTGYAHRRVYGERFWQDGYFDRHLRREEVTLDIVSYIVCNPVRAGLCVSVEDYPWSGSSVYPLREILQDMRWRPRSLG